MMKSEKMRKYLRRVGNVIYTAREAQPELLPMNLGTMDDLISHSLII